MTTMPQLDTRPAVEIVGVRKQFAGRSR
ncbi:MAG: hypothetical protein QOJ48_116, partial [Frankiales bacterium]|nr:hypothetical protein [Frankiales bacterium]